MVNKEIYKELKKRIVYLDYKPKQVLNIKELAKEFGVSPMPIREVLILLETEKLVHIIPNNGIYVTDVSFQELKDVDKTRKRQEKINSIGCRIPRFSKLLY
jgi:DNA-binding GntR family transcriptional regulator